MAFLKKRGNVWFAVWREKGAKITKSTGIPVKGRREEKLALAAAESMEKTAKGQATLHVALDAVKATAELNGISSTMPTIKGYLESFQPNGRQQNAINYNRAVARFLDFLAEDANKRLDCLTPAQCRAFAKKELDRVAYGTVKHYVALLKAALNTAVQDDILLKNPFAFVSLAKIAPTNAPRATKRLPFTLSEMHFILTRFPKDWRDVCLTSFATGGQRIGDISLLRWESVDFYTNTITFDTMKTGKRISAPMVAPLRAMLKEREGNHKEYVFPEFATKYKRSKGCLSVAFTALLKAHGIIKEKPPVEGARKPPSEKSFHSIRHTVVSLLRSSNLFTADLAREIVGHDSEAIERAYFTAAAEAKYNGLSYLMKAVKKGAEPYALPPSMNTGLTLRTAP